MNSKDFIAVVVILLFVASILGMVTDNLNLGFILLIIGFILHVYTTRKSS